MVSYHSDLEDVEMEEREREWERANGRSRPPRGSLPSPVDENGEPWSA